MTDGAPDPLTTFISRSLRVAVSDVREEILQDTTEAEIDRIHFTQDGSARTLIIKRLPPHDAVEVKLLPHLARKTDRVPSVHARGIPPATAAGWPWLLVEDLHGAPPACDDLEAIVAAKVVVERSVALDGPALVALGVPRIASRGPLAAWPEVIVHGALTCANAVRAARGVVILEWRHASLGCGLLDIVRLSRDAGVPVAGLADRYASLTGRSVDAATVAAAEALV